LSAPRIIVVGSYATGLTMRVERLPSPGETLLGTGYRVDYGGKGSNQAVGCARLGARVSFVARIGQDTFGDMALELYRDEGIDVAHVKQRHGVPTGVGFIIVDASGNNCITIDPGANEYLTAEDISLGDCAFDAAAVVLTQLEIPVVAAAAAMAHGRARRALTILNPAPVRPLPESILRLVDIITPNQSEARVLAGRGPVEALDTGEFGLEEIARDLIRRGVKQVVMTLGEKGALIVTASSSRHIPALRMTAVDTTGAGDAFNAGLATALACGADLEGAVHFAVVTGGLAVTKEGVIPSLPHRDQVLRCYRQNGLNPPDWFLTSSSVGN